MNPEQTVLSTPWGSLVLTISKNTVLAASFALSTTNFSSNPKSAIRNAHYKHIIQRIKSYLKSPCDLSDIETDVQGTPFEQRVWSKLREIPMGSVATYGQIAKALRTSPRAVGQACRKNPCVLLVPCHRVVASQGLGGFMGQTSGGLAIKAELLHHEGNSSPQIRDFYANVHI